MTPVPAEILAGAAAQLFEFGRLDAARTIAELALSEDSGCANAHSVLAVLSGEPGERLGDAPVRADRRFGAAIADSGH